MYTKMSHETVLLWNKVLKNRFFSHRAADLFDCDCGRIFLPGVLTE